LALAGIVLLGALGCGDGVDLDEFENRAPPPREASLFLPPLKVRLANNGNVLRSSSGKRVDITPTLVTGYVDKAVVSEDYVDMGGWAAPSDLEHAAGAVVAVVNQTGVAGDRPSDLRPELVEDYPRIANAGFLLRLPRSTLDCSAPAQGLTIYGVARDAAGPLTWLGDVPKIVAAAC
jgi:hypothetical protein